MARRVLLRLMAAAGAIACLAVIAASALADASPAPGIAVVALQRDGSAGTFTADTIFALVGKPIEYEIQATNTGNTPLTLSLVDPLCDSGTVTGPAPVTGTLSGDVLSPGGEAQYTCSHLLKGPGDASPFVNTATVSGQPPSGQPVSGTSSATANKQAIGATKVLRCPPGKVRRTRRRHGMTVTVCAAKKRATLTRRPQRSRGFTG